MPIARYTFSLCVEKPITLGQEETIELKGRPALQWPELTLREMDAEQIQMNAPCPKFFKLMTLEIAGSGHSLDIPHEGLDCFEITLPKSIPLKDNQYVRAKVFYTGLVPAPYKRDSSFHPIFRFSGPAR